MTSRNPKIRHLRFIALGLRNLENGGDADSGIMVSALTTGSSGPGVLEQDRHYSHIASLRSEELAAGAALVMLGVTVRQTSIAPEGSRATVASFHASKTGSRHQPGLISHLART